jgi:hypothetical protein
MSWTLLMQVVFLLIFTAVTMVASVHSVIDKLREDAIHRKEGGL